MRSSWWCERCASVRDFSRDIPPQGAGPRAQASGDGIGIQNVRRGTLFAELTGQASSVAVPSGELGAFAPLATQLRGQIVCSGRPLLVKVAGITQAGTGGRVALTVAMNGRDLVGRLHGLPGTYNDRVAPVGVVGVWFVPAPPAGEVTIEVWANATNAAATIYVTTGNTLLLVCLEV